MTPQDKAEELFQLYLPYVQSSNYIEEIKYKCKQCALIAVDEILNSTPYGWYDKRFFSDKMKKFYEYWEEVKQEIEKL